MVDRNSMVSKALFYAIGQGIYIEKDGRVMGRKGKYINGSNREGYINISIVMPDGKHKNILRSRLQAYTKYGDELFKEGIMVRHLNGDSTDDSWDNIAIGTMKDNTYDMTKEARVSRSKIRKGFSPEKIIEIRAMYKEGNTSYKKLAELYETSETSIWRIVTYKSYNFTVSRQRLLSDEDACRIRAIYAEGYTDYKMLGKEYGLSAKSIRDVIKFLSYKNARSEKYKTPDIMITRGRLSELRIAEKKLKEIAELDDTFVLRDKIQAIYKEDSYG